MKMIRSVPDHILGNFITVKVGNMAYLEQLSNIPNSSGFQAMFSVCDREASNIQAVITENC